MLSPPDTASVVSTPKTLVGSDTYFGFSDNVYDAPAPTEVSVAPTTPATTVAAVSEVMTVIR